VSDELKEMIQETISYYDNHRMSDFVHGNDERLKNFLVDDFTKLLEALGKELA